MITQNLSVTIARNGVPPILSAVQGDTGRNVEITLKDYSIPAGATATVYVAKHSGNAVYNTATVADGKITVALTAQMLAETGENTMQVRVFLNDEVITSFAILLIVSAFEGVEAVETTTEMNIFDQAVEQAEAEIEAAGEEVVQEISTYLDPTLTQENKAADAKAVGDEITEVKADITELDETVNGVSGGTQDVTSSVSWTTGYSVSYSNGALVEKSNYSYADIPLNGASKVSGYTRAGQETSQGMCFLDANGNWLWGDYHAGASSYAWDYDFDVVTNATTLRICCSNNFLSDFTCTLTFASSTGLVDDVTTLQTSVASLDTAVNGGQVETSTEKTVDDFTAIDYYIGTSSGKWVSGSNRAYVIAIGDTTKVALTGHAERVAEVAFLSNNEYSAGSAAPILGGSSTPTTIAIGASVELDVPEGTAYFYMRRINGDGWNIVPASIVFYTTTTEAGLVSGVSTLTTKMATAESAIGELSYTWIDGYYVNRYTYGSTTTVPGLLMTSDTYSVALVDVSAYAGGAIVGHTQLGDDQGVAFYDAYGTFISGTSKASGDPASYDYDFAVPDGAKMAIITCKTVNKSEFTVAGEGLSDGGVAVSETNALEYECPQWVYGLDSPKSDFHYDSETLLNDMYDWFDILTSTFPRNITRVQIGTSTTPEGDYAAVDDSTYPIYGYVIQGDYYIEGNDFILAAGLHGDGDDGDGIQSPVSVAYFIKDMLCNPQKNKYLNYMKRFCKILVVPVLNPWGYQNRYRCNGRGVDCNRNFDINFVANQIEYGYSSGTAAFSENETLYIKNYIVNNFADAKFCVELHTRGETLLEDDDRWHTKVIDTNTTGQEALTAVGYWMKRIYAGGVSNNVKVAPDELLPAFWPYIAYVVGIPTNLVECAKTVNIDITTYNSDLVQIQYVQYLGSMVQKLLETFVM